MALLWDEMEREDLKGFLDEKAGLYNSASFVESDPIQVPHQFERPEDIEIAAFLTATIAWGRKSSIIASAKKLLSWMTGGPYEFLVSAGRDELTPFLPFVHRTFNGIDCVYFLEALKRIYLYEGGLREAFEGGYLKHGDLAPAIIDFRKVFFSRVDPGRSAKHLPDITRNAAGKRLNMFMRWMVRQDERGVDFGLWKRIPAGALYIPLDVHTGNVARKLGLLERKQNDWKSVVELTGRLREFDPEDPVRYDFALFGLGSFEKF
jgi:uncharacterized protein (TIGR02757 family)